MTAMLKPRRESKLPSLTSSSQLLFYHHEAAFTFKKYINCLKKCFDILEKYQVPYHEEDKVKLLLDRIQNTNHGECKTQVSICRANISDLFVQASTYMSRESSHIFFPSSNVASLNFGKGRNRGSRNVSSTKQCGQNGKRKGLIVKNNGVDINDLMRFYTKEEWKKLDADVKKRIL
jgi:hypothetical protein